MDMAVSEVLAPCGNMDALRAAVFAGADAVYLGGTHFSARASAKNFTDEQLSEAVEFCHIRDVKVYVTVNTLVKEDELKDIMEFIKYLCKIAVDAVIVQDMGILRLIRMAAPDLAVHASTQMSVHTPAGARLLQELGVKRVVLARELSFEEIKAIKESTDIELEVFVHGALCMSVSGQCYLSSVLGGRSGNRGMCAQPCRLPFSAQGGTGYDLSLKDLSLIDDIGELKKLGVASFKIEGRMKRPEYVAGAVSAIRHAADGTEIPKGLRENLGAVFSRSGFTDGYLKGKTGPGMFGIRTAEDVKTADKKVMASLHELYRTERKAVAVTLVFDNSKGVLTVSDGTNTVSLQSAGTGCSDMLPVERCIQQMKKTGGTPYYAERAEVENAGVSGETPVVNISLTQLNALRREALEKLSSERARVKEIPFNFNFKPELSKGSPKRAHNNRVMKYAAFSELSQLDRYAGEFDKIYLPVQVDLKKLNDTLEACKIDKSKVFFEIPRVILGYGAEKAVLSFIEEKKDAGFLDFVCGNIGAVATCKELKVRAHGGFSLNITNSEALNFYESIGLQNGEISFEMSGNEVGRIVEAARSSMGLGLMVYGRQEVMLTRNCPAANGRISCGKCQGDSFITDRMKKNFPVRCTRLGKHSFSTVFNTVPLSLSDSMNGVGMLDFVVFRYTVENSVECRDILQAFKEGKKLETAYTKGLFSRGIH